MKSLIDLEPNECRYPYGDSDFKFCGAPQHIHVLNGKMVQSSYCKEHRLLCTVEPYAKRVAA
jgi:hypothetical protein